jgi:hypothetical protein
LAQSLFWNRFKDLTAAKFLPPLRIHPELLPHGFSRKKMAGSNGRAPPNKSTTACAGSRPGREHSLPFGARHAICGGVRKALRQRKRTRPPAKSFHRQRKFTSCAAKEPFCDWNPFNLRDASGSPRKNSQMAHGSLLEIGLLRSIAISSNIRS